MHKRIEKPRRNCGQKNSSPVYSEVIGVIRHSERAKRKSPAAMSRRGSSFRESLAINGADRTMARPALKTASPICKALNPADSCEKERQHINGAEKPEPSNEDEEGGDRKGAVF
jgi:hypothetical protein